MAVSSDLGLIPGTATQVLHEYVREETAEEAERRLAELALELRTLSRELAALDRQIRRERRLAVFALVLALGGLLGSLLTGVVGWLS